jgi:hypothetical protein
MYLSLRFLPLLVFPLVFYMLCAALMPGGAWTHDVAFAPYTFSGASWVVSYGDLFVFFSLLVLFVEIVKSVNTDARVILNHGLSTVVALVSTVLFVTFSSFTNSSFFLLLTMMFIDVVAGFAITTISARRDFGTQG